jgi:2-iminobutanoate/2-iminopropanoate deaminase
VRQKSIEVPGLSHHGAPIPTACRVGPILVTSRIMGKDPDTGHMPADPGEQAELCFKNLQRVLEAGGMDMGDVVKLTVYLVSDSYRTAVNKPWHEYYPDPAQRPTRDSLVMPLRGANLIQIEAWAIAKELG